MSSTCERPIGARIVSVDYLLFLVLNPVAAPAPNKPSPSPALQVKTRATGDVRLEQQQQRAPSGNRPRPPAPSHTPTSAPVRYSTAARPSAPAAPAAAAAAKDGFEVVSNNRRPTPVSTNSSSQRKSPFAGAKPVNRPPQTPNVAAPSAAAAGRFGALAAASEADSKELPHFGWEVKPEETAALASEVTSPVETASPTAPSEEDSGKLLAVFEEYVRQHNLSDVLDEIKSEGLLVSLIIHALDQRKYAQALVPVLEGVKDLPREKCLSLAMANLSEMAVDLPVVYEHAGIVLVPWLGSISSIFPQIDTHASRAIHWSLTHLNGLSAKMEKIMAMPCLPGIGSHGGDRLSEVKALVALSPIHAKLLGLGRVDEFAIRAKEVLMGESSGLGNAMVAWSLAMNLIRLIGQPISQPQRVKEEILPQLIPCLAMISVDEAEWKDPIQKALKESALSDADAQIIADGLKELGI